MNIPTTLLRDYGAVVKHYRRRDEIFHERQVAFYYFQIESGLVKMINRGDEHDFIQGIFTEGESFGEPPMLGKFPYPASACAITDTNLLALSRKHFIELLRPISICTCSSPHISVSACSTRPNCSRLSISASRKSAYWP